MAAAHNLGQGAFGGHGLNVALDDVSRIGQFDDKGRIALVPGRIRIGHGHDHGQIRSTSRRGKPFFAVQHIVLIAILDGAGLHARRIGPGGLFGHGIANPLFAIQQRLEVFFLLVLGAMREQGQHGGIIRALTIHRQGAQMAFAQFHLHQGIGQGAKAHAAIFNRNKRAPKTLASGLGAQAGQDRLEVAAIGKRLFGGHALIMHKLAHLGANGLGLSRNFKIDRHGLPPDRRASPSLNVGHATYAHAHSLPRAAVQVKPEPAS